MREDEQTFSLQIAANIAEEIMLTSHERRGYELVRAFTLRLDLSDGRSAEPIIALARKHGFTAHLSEPVREWRGNPVYRYTPIIFLNEVPPCQGRH
jgi:hypothetical protein